jgi:hypothetical protein
LSEDMQKRIVLILSTALAAWTATKLAGLFLDEPEERGSEDDVKEALVQGTFSLVRLRYYLQFHLAALRY